MAGRPPAWIDSVSHLSPPALSRRCSAQRCPHAFESLAAGLVRGVEERGICTRRGVTLPKFTRLGRTPVTTAGGQLMASSIAIPFMLSTVLSSQQSGAAVPPEQLNRLAPTHLPLEPALWSRVKYWSDPREGESCELGRVPCPLQPLQRITQLDTRK